MHLTLVVTSTTWVQVCCAVTESFRVLQIGDYLQNDDLTLVIISIFSSIQIEEKVNDLIVFLAKE